MWPFGVWTRREYGFDEHKKKTIFRTYFINIGENRHKQTVLRKKKKPYLNYKIEKRFWIAFTLTICSRIPLDFGRDDDYTAIRTKYSTHTNDDAVLISNCVSCEMSNIKSKYC